MRALDVMNTGIYTIEHVSSGRSYIGSAINFAARWRVHLCRLRKGTHHSAHLQSAWSKYGEASFKFKKLMVCSADNLMFYEQRMIDGYQAFNREHGFNARPVASSQLGMKHSDAAREKIRAKRATQVFSAETRALMSKNQTGKKMPDWFGEFTRQHRTGTKHTDEAKAKISAIQRGRPQHSSSSRAKLTPAETSEIRALLAVGNTTQTAIAKRFGVHQSAISLINSRKRWSTT